MTLVFAQWNDEYATGHQKVDEQHKHLFEIINKLHDAMKRGHGKAILRETFDELIKYTIEHFIMEELLMVANHYPQFKEHKIKHEYLKKQVQDLRAKFEDGTIIINIELLSFLNKWLVHHIKEDDFTMIDFIHQQQAQKMAIKSKLEKYQSLYNTIHSTKY